METHDDLLLRVERAAPGFGGMFIDRDSRLTVYLMDSAQLPAARAAIESVFGPARNTGSGTARSRRSVHRVAARCVDPASRSCDGAARRNVGGSRRGEKSRCDRCRPQLEDAGGSAGPWVDEHSARRRRDRYNGPDTAGGSTIACRQIGCAPQLFSNAVAILTPPSARGSVLGRSRIGCCLLRASRRERMGVGARRRSCAPTLVPFSHSGHGSGGLDPLGPWFRKFLLRRRRNRARTFSGRLPARDV